MMMMMMDNPEDVLQALDEFQKMRPSEIPKVLEEYLMWVAKTGEPIYQWSLIKTLFREKLLRVMTEFYESGNPSLLGPPLPNVEPFNYENMKSSLLERLENFANPPFTVQRICELLIAPRREYNRIDKYMRAVEKNILVVSTREPGTCGRRSENGDSLVNGSVEDESSHHGQSSNDVDMENWVKDCTTAAPPVAIHTDASDDMAVDSELKSSFDKHDRLEQLTAIDATTSSFVAAASDFQVATTMPPQIPAQEVSAVVQNLAAIAGEAPVLADVDAIMNEDTSSQPSLELESDDNDSNDSKKLQTTFQAKDFKLDEGKSSDSESQDSKSEESIDSAESSKESELIQSAFMDEKPVSESADEAVDAVKIAILGAVASESEKIIEKTDENQIGDKSEIDSNECIDSFQLANNDLETKQNDTVEAIDTSAIIVVSMDSTETPTQEKVEDKAEPIVLETTEELAEPTKELTEIVEEPSSESSKPITEEPLSEAVDSISTTKSESIELTIQETAGDETNAKTIVPDPIPIVEEPKETEPVIKSVDDVVSAPVSEELSEPQSVIANVNNGLEELPVITEKKEDNLLVVSGCEEAVDSKGATESMDVDNDGLTSIVQQEEPMDQDATEAMNS